MAQWLSLVKVLTDSPLSVYYLAYGGAGQRGSTMPDSRWQYTIWKRLLCIQVACSDLLETLAVQPLRSPESACAACEVILVHVIILFSVYALQSRL